MPVTYLELENFKSYAGYQRIGPFQDFTSVIGPNGSGKSNLMDAISFVFGVQSKDLRSSQMKDLIFRKPGKAPTQKLRARASLIYEDEDSGKETVFSRLISSQGVGEYQVNGNTASFKEYESALAEIGVLLKARNFLVFQGDVISIAHKSAKELVELVEQVSGSVDLKEDYERMEKQKDTAEASTNFCYNKQKSLKGERRLLKDQKEEADRFHNLQEKKRRTLTESYLWELYHLEQDIEEREESIQQFQQQLQATKEREDETSSSLKQLKKMASAARRETAKVDKARVALASSISNQEPAVIQSTEEIKKLQKNIAKDEKLITKLDGEKENQKNTLKSLKDDIQEYNTSLTELEQQYVEQKSQKTDGVVLTEEQEEEFDRVKQAAAAASDGPKRELKKFARQLQTKRAQGGTYTHDLEELEASHADKIRQVEELTSRRDKLQEVSELI